MTPSEVHPGEVVSLSPNVGNTRLLIGGTVTEFESRSLGQWILADYLTSPYGTATNYGVVSARGSAGFLGVGTYAPIEVRIPDVRSGTYRLASYFSPAGGNGSFLPGHYPNKGAYLCSEVQVLSTRPTLSASNDVSVQAIPSSGLRDGKHIRVNVSGFGVRGVVSLSECAFFGVVATSGCGTALNSDSLIHVNKNGTASVTYVAAGRALSSSRGRTFPCTATNCVLVATLGSGFAYAVTRLSFRVPGAATGYLHFVGGPAPGLDKPIPGTVRFQASSGASYETSPASDGEFSLILPPGRYLVEARSPNFISVGTEWPCRGQPDSLVVKPGQTIDEPVFCDAP